MNNQDKIDQLEAHNRALVEALERLVTVKAHKDEWGKDNFYLDNQPIAWEKAKQALSNSPVDLCRKEQAVIEAAIAWGQADMSDVDLTGDVEVKLVDAIINFQQAREGEE